MSVLERELEFIWIEKRKRERELREPACGKIGTGIKFWWLFVNVPYPSSASKWSLLNTCYRCPVPPADTFDARQRPWLVAITPFTLGP